MEEQGKDELINATHHMLTIQLLTYPIKCSVKITCFMERQFTLALTIGHCGTGPKSPKFQPTSVNVV